MERKNERLSKGGDTTFRMYKEMHIHMQAQVRKFPYFCSLRGVVKFCTLTVVKFVLWC